MKKHLPFLICLGIVAIFIIGTCVFPIQSEDLWMYLNLGEWWNQHGILPNKDPYLFWSTEVSFYGFHQWLSYLIIYYTELVSGLNGVILLKTLILFFCFTLPILKEKKSPGPIWFVALILAFYSSGFKWVERTSLISDLLTVLVILTVNGKFKYSWKGLISLSIIAILWVNAHPSFPLLFILLGVSALTDAIQKISLTASEKKIRFALLFLPILFLANPLGFQGALYPITFMMNEGKVMSQYFTEWMPTFATIYRSSFHTYCLIALALTAAGSLCFWDRKNLFAWFVLLLFFAELMQAIRFATTFSFVSCLIIYQAQLKARSQSFWLQSASYAILVGLSAWFITNGTDTISGHRSWGFGVDQKLLPKDSAEFIQKNNLQGNVFNTHVFGCGLTYLWNHQRKVFFHGFMTDMNFYKSEYQGFFRTLPEFQEKVQKYQIEAFIVDRFQGIQPLVNNIQADGRWKIAFIDEGSAVFTKK